MTKPVRTVVFLGPDGAGKTTLLNLVESKLAARGVDFRRYYFAPGFLKRYRPTDPVTTTANPHEGRQYGAVLAFLKISLMLLEFHFGLPRATRSNKLVLFDRFIQDLLIDPRRYRIGHVRWWMRAMLAVAPRADLYVTIIAPTNVIQSRKQEVPPEETERQVSAYAKEAANFPQGLLIENVGPPEATAQRIVEGIFNR